MSRISEKIRAEIAIHGAITFARFMDLALYCPDTGYYETDNDTVGRGGDFYTSVSVGPVFGELLAFQIAEWMAPTLAQREPTGTDRAPGVEVGVGNVPDEGFRLIEAGAHEGRLAKDILTWLRQWRPALFARAEYWIVEPSTRRRQKQCETLKEFSPKVHWASTLATLGRATIRIKGVILANELLDAMPVHRIGWDPARQVWFEWGVEWNDNGFAWVRLPDSIPEAIGPCGVSTELLKLLPDGFSTEIGPFAEQWWSEAAGVLPRGRWLTFDYGLESEEFFAPHRSQGTLRAYRKHQQSNNVLAYPGEQDLTAHVNFSRIRRAGEAAGLRTERITTQARFLTEIAERFWREPARNGPWTAKQSRELKTLIHPEQLGRAFRVLLQSR
ncbi:MAG: SAM-dependent methyltransferase [Verrucomicrobiota bacterium]